MNFITANWPAPKHVRAYTTLRYSWNWQGHDTPETNQALKSLLSLPQDPIWLDQHTHSAIAVAAKPENIMSIADASFTQEKNCICAVRTADCLPILLCNTKGSQVAAIHAGWRGLASGVVEATVKQLNPNDQWLAWLGPAIGADKFEVGLDVYQAFTQHNAQAASAFKAISLNKWLADLYALARLRLKQQGITAVYGGEYCTYTQANLFYSYRRDKNQAGRMASLIWIE